MPPTALKLAIVHDGRTQQEIALAAGVHPTQLSRVVRGLPCSEAMQCAIALVLGVPVSELWPGHGDASDHNPVRPGPSSEEIAA